MHQDSVKSLMKAQAISVLPNTPVLTVIDILLTNRFNGIPVVDKDNILVGIITKYDLIIRRGSIFDDMEAKDVMNKEPLVLSDDMSVEDAVSAFSEHHRVDPIPVIDQDKKLVGIISRSDMIQMFRGYVSDVPNFKNEPHAVKEIPLLEGRREERRGAGAAWLIAAALLALAVLGYLFYLRT